MDVPQEVWLAEMILLTSILISRNSARALWAPGSSHNPPSLRNQPVPTSISVYRPSTQLSTHNQGPCQSTSGGMDRRRSHFSGNASQSYFQEGVQQPHRRSQS